MWRFEITFFYNINIAQNKIMFLYLILGILPFPAGSKDDEKRFHQTGQFILTGAEAWVKWWKVIR